MQIGDRLESLANMVPQGAKLADIGTDHAYLPVYLLENGRISNAIAGDIAAGPCMAARTTVAQHGLTDKVQVRQGSGLEVLTPGEVDCVTIAGMGGSTMIEILKADMALSKSIPMLILQPMAGAAGLRAWLVENGWKLVNEDLVDDAPHFYEVLCAVPREPEEPAAQYTAAQLAVGPVVLQKGHPLLDQQIARQVHICEELLTQMGRSERARQSDKYRDLKALFIQLKEL